MNRPDTLPATSACRRINPRTGGSPSRGYTCRGCGTTVSYPGTFRKCPVCGIKWS